MLNSAVAINGPRSRRRKSLYHRGVALLPDYSPESDGDIKEQPNIFMMPAPEVEPDTKPDRQETERIDPNAEIETTIKRKLTVDELVALPYWPFDDGTEAAVSEDYALKRWEEESKKHPDPRRFVIVKAKRRYDWLRRYNTILPDGSRLMGGPQEGSGRLPRKEALGKRIADMAEGEKQRDVINALFSGLDSDEDARTRVKTATEITKITQKQRELEFEERKYEEEPLQDLKRMLAKRLAGMTQSGDLPDPRESDVDVIEGTARGR